MLQDRARAKAVVVEILQHNADRLHPVISQFVTVALTGANFDTGVVCRSSSGVLHELISELNKVDSNLMLHILPVVAQQLQVGSVRSPCSSSVFSFSMCRLRTRTTDQQLWLCCLVCFLTSPRTCRVPTPPTSWSSLEGALFPLTSHIASGVPC